MDLWFFSLEVPDWSLFLARAKNGSLAVPAWSLFLARAINSCSVLDRAKNGSLEVPVWSHFLARAKKGFLLNCLFGHFS